MNDIDKLFRVDHSVAIARMLNLDQNVGQDTLSKIIAKSPLTKDVQLLKIEYTKQLSALENVLNHLPSEKKELLNSLFPDMHCIKKVIQD